MVEHQLTALFADLTPYLAWALPMERERSAKKVAESAASYGEEDRATTIERLEREMREAAANLDFETAARLRDQLFELKAKAAGNVARSRGAFADIRAHS